MNLSDSLRMILAQAMAEPIGLLVQTSDFARARQAFYRARAEDGSGQFSELQFRASPGIEGGDLIIVRQRVEVAALPGLPAPTV